MLGRRARVSSWDELVLWFDSQRWKSIAEKTAVSFVINAVVYEVWRNRNDAVFRGSCLDSAQVISLVDRLLRLKIDLKNVIRCGVELC